MNVLIRGRRTTDEGVIFVLGMCLGSLSMLFIMLGIIVQMHDRIEQNRWKL